MSDRCRARVIRVRVDRHTAVLASAAAVADTTLMVRDAGDLAAEAGTLLADDDAGTLLTYSSVAYAEDADASDLTSPDTITLATPLTVALDEGAELSVWDVDEVLADYIAICVPEDDEDAVVSGEPIRATIPPHLQDDLPVGRQPGDGVRVVLEYDDDTDEWSVARFVGSARGIRFETDDVHTVDDLDVDAGTVVVRLSHKPLPESIKLWWRSTWQPPTEYVVDEAARTVTMDLGDFVEAGDEVRVHYAYRKGLAGPVVAWPDTITYVGAYDPTLYPTTGTTGPEATALGDGTDSTFAMAAAAGNLHFDRMVLGFTIPIGTGGVAAESLGIRFRVKMTDDGGDGQTRVRVKMYDTATNGTDFYCDWQASLPVHGDWYDEGLPLVDESASPGDHWWIFRNLGPGASILDDPWPTLTALIAAGNLTAEVQRVTNAGTRPWTTGDVTVAELTVTWL